MDGDAATRCAIEHAVELGIDRDRLAVGGDSAGATLAAIVCQLARRAKGVQLAAQLLSCPITDFAAKTASRSAFAEGYLLDKAMMDRDLEHYTPGRPGSDGSTHLAASCFGLERAALGIIHTGEVRPLARRRQSLRRGFNGFRG
jgi:acetyl esterase